MLTMTGKGVYGAVAIGKVSVFKRGDLTVKRTRIQDVDAEKTRLDEAKRASLAELREIYEKALKEIGETNAQIFEIHQMMVEDEDYNESIINIIETQHVNAEYAIATTADNFAEMFASMDDSYMQARAADVKDISNRLIKNLMRCEEETSVFDHMIVCSDDLAPSETVSLDKEKVCAFVTAHGSSNSHTAILARNMNIPAVIGLGDAFLSAVKDGDDMIVDGFTGTIYINPDESTMADMQKKKRESEEKQLLLQKLKGQPNVTLDGTEIKIYANIGSTADIGADKQADYFDLEKEENPALGLRAIRLCLSRPAIFKTQLRALLRASVYGNLGIMFPMIAAVSELKQALRILEDVKSELRASCFSLLNGDNMRFSLQIYNFQLDSIHPF